jgi:thiamine kinase-like enzyme
MDTLLAQLDRGNMDVPGWRIQPIIGGANNLLYHATGEAGDFAIKFTINDPRRRAKREYDALSLLQTLDLDLAPRPVLYDERRYSLPVIVQTWVEGETLTAPPDTDEDWRGLLDYHAAVHRITAPLEKPVLYAESPEQCRAIIREKLERLPLGAQPDSLRTLWARFNRLRLPRWEAPTLALVRNDPNPRNFIRRDGQRWSSVDWEYSGVTDPAFQIADLLAHPQYMTLTRERQEWIIACYTSLVDDSACETRIRTYWLTLTLWWVARFAQYLYEVPLGLDPRLVERPATWREDGERKYAHYVNMVELLFSTTMTYPGYKSLSDRPT